MIKRLIVSTIVGAIVSLVLGFLIYGLALQSYFKANSNQFPSMMKDPPNWILLIGAHIAFALLLSVIAECWANARSFSAGLKIGVIVTFLVAVWADSMFESMMDLFKGAMPLVVDVIAATILGTITGGVIGFVLGKLGKQEEAA